MTTIYSLEMIHINASRPERTSHPLSIFSNVGLCAAALNDLSTILKDPNCQHLDQTQSFAIEDEARRFKLWASNIGALQGPEIESSLDYRLREAPQVRQQAINILKRLTFSAKQGLCCLTNLYFRQEPCFSELTF
jgi:hypothetical protein